MIDVVAAAGADDGIGADFQRQFRHNLRRGIRQYEEHRIGRHALDHLLGDRAGDRQTDKYIRPLQGVVQRASVGRDGEFGLVNVHVVFALMVEHTAGIEHENVFPTDSQRLEELAGGDGTGARAVDDDFDILHFLAGDLKRVEQRRAGDDGGAVLIVMEDGDVQLFDESLFDLEAFGRFDIFQVDAAEGGRQRLADPDDFLCAARCDLNIEDIDIGEFLEEYAFAFHHWFGSERSAVAQAEDGAAI